MNTPPATVDAQWTVELNCDCPKCKVSVNLLDYPDFWIQRQLEIPEHGTERSDNLEVGCPECDHQFTVCCVW
jgi:phage FluMu protein Com